MSAEHEDLSVQIQNGSGVRWNIRMKKFVYHAARTGGDFRKAAKEAGYADPEYGYQLWQKPEIRQAIEQELLACLQKLDENSETIIARWSNWLRGNVYDYFKMDQDGVLVLRDPQELTDAQKSRVKKISASVNQYGQNVTVELHDQSKAQDRLAEILGLINSQHQSNTPQETAVAIRDLISKMSATRFEGAPDDVTLN